MAPTGQNYKKTKYNSVNKINFVDKIQFRRQNCKIHNKIKIPSTKSNFVWTKSNFV